MSRRTWKERLLGLVEIVLALGLFTDYLALTLLSPFPAVSRPLSSVRALAVTTTLSSVLLLGLLAVLQRLRGEALFGPLLGPKRRWSREAARGLRWLPAIFAVSYALKSLFRHFAPAIYSGERNVLEEMMRNPADLALFLFVALFSGGIKEELQRGIVIRRFETGWGPGWLGALLFALYFGLGHRVQGWDEAIIAGLFGLAWGIMFARRRSVVGPMVCHGLYDALELLRYYLFGPMRFI